MGRLVCIFGYLILAAGVAYGQYELSREISTRCQISEQSRAILRDEHTTKLSRARAYLNAHPNGTHDIPRRLILQSIGDEKAILAKVQPRPCP